MIRLTPIETKDVVIDGVTFVLKPWLAVDEIAIAMALTVQDKARIAVNASVVGWHGEGIEPFAKEKIDRLPSSVYVALFNEAQLLSVATKDEVRV